MKKSKTEFYGGFWQRFGASMIDVIFITAVSAGINFALGVSNSPVQVPATNSDAIYAFLFSMVASFLYYSIVQGMFKGTIGKHMMGLTLVDSMNYEKISIGQSVGRYLMSLCSALCVGAGYFVVGFNKRKQSWHDKAAGTVVVKKSCLHHLKNDGVYELGSNYTKAA